MYAIRHNNLKGDGINMYNTFDFEIKTKKICISKDLTCKELNDFLKEKVGRIIDIKPISEMYVLVIYR